VARAYIKQLDKAGVFADPVVTTVENGKTFYPAEAYHQNYLVDHPNEPYILINDRPKVAALKQLYPSLYRAKPVLVG
jgi:peptide-methionine (S)-S-oxide reductase